MSSSNGTKSTTTLNGTKSTSSSSGSKSASTSNITKSTSTSNGTKSTSNANGTKSTSISNGTKSTSTSNGTKSTSNANGTKSTSISNGTKSTSTSNADRRSIDQPKRNDSKSKSAELPNFTTADLLEAFRGLRLDDKQPDLCRLQGDTRKLSPEKTAYSVARKVAPTEPGTYKIYRKENKEEAYIGHTKNLKKRLTDHAYGSQHVDTFLRSEGGDAEVSFELSPTKEDARSREKSQLMAFKEAHGHLPEFNHRI